MRAIFEAWNARLWDDASGVLLWMSHPAWHSTVWQTYDYDLDVNGSYYGARKGCEPHHVQADLSNWRIRAVNHTRSALTGATVTAQLYDLAGTELGPAQTQIIDVGPSAAGDVFSTAFGSTLPALHLLRLRLTDHHGTQLSENTYWRYRTDTDLRALNNLPPVRVSVALRPAGDNTYTATVHNTGSHVAAMIRLSLREQNGEDRVLPTRYGDNFFWLLPGETRAITVAPRRRVTHPRLVLEGYNVTRTTQPLS
jgi:hypothetical protein